MSLDTSSRLIATGIAKSYGATVALDNVSIGIGSGKVHALLGENGAGKSTLVKILSGVVRPNIGSMKIEHRNYEPRSILDARQAGVATAFQELSLPPNLSVYQALLLPSLPKGFTGLVSRARSEEAAQNILDRHNISDVPVRSSISGLSLAQRQRLEIARAMNHATSVLILDEPTAALTDVDWLFSLIRERTTSGLSVLYISHRLAEVRQLCASATVLRNGRSVADVDLAESTDSDIFKMMVGRNEGGTRAGPRKHFTPTDFALETDKLRGAKLDGVSLALHKGEILGIAGLEGQGQRELFRSIVGLESIGSGSIKVAGNTVSIKNPGFALRQGIAFVPEERKVDGLFPALSTAGNIVLPILSRISLAGLVTPFRESEAAKTKSNAVDLSPRYLDFAISDLSGGNQQKAILARALITGAPTLLLFDPTRGVDVGTKEAIYAAIRNFATQGGSVLIYSSELPELVQLADRCLVVYGGKIFAEFWEDDIQEEALVAALTGHHGDEADSARRNIA